MKRRKRHATLAPPAVCIEQVECFSDSRGRHRVPRLLTIRHSVRAHRLLEEIGDEDRGRNRRYHTSHTDHRIKERGHLRRVEPAHLPSCKLRAHDTTAAQAELLCGKGAHARPVKAPLNSYMVALCCTCCNMARVATCCTVLQLACPLGDGRTRRVAHRCAHSSTFRGLQTHSVNRTSGGGAAWGTAGWLARFAERAVAVGK